MKLNDNIHQKIITLSEEGDNFFEDSNYVNAIKKYHLALDLLPTPKDQWEASTWLYVAIGDAFFYADNYQAAYDWFKDALNYPDAIENPFIHLRLGQALYHLGCHEKATDSLLKAYMLDGVEVFENEGAMYLNFLKSKINL